MSGAASNVAQAPVGVPTTEMQQLSLGSQTSQQTSAGSTQQHPQVLQPDPRVLQQPREPFPQLPFAQRLPQHLGPQMVQ